MLYMMGRAATYDTFFPGGWKVSSYGGIFFFLRHLLYFFFPLLSFFFCFDFFVTFCSLVSNVFLRSFGTCDRHHGWLTPGLIVSVFSSTVVAGEGDCMQSSSCFHTVVLFTVRSTFDAEPGVCEWGEGGGRTHLLLSLIFSLFSRTFRGFSTEWFLCRPCHRHRTARVVVMLLLRRVGS